MSDFTKLLCRIFGHRRSIGSARAEGDGGWISLCRNCGIKMRRDPYTHKWSVESGRATPDR